MTYKGFISTLMAAAIAITSIAVKPAQADSDTAKIITGIAALTLLGVAISESQRSNKGYVARSHNHGYANRYYKPRHRYYAPRRHVHRRHHGHGFRKRGHYGFRY